MPRTLKWLGGAALLGVVLAGALTFGWRHSFTEDEPLEPGLFYEINPDIVTEVVFSAADYKLYAYRWSVDDNFHIAVLRPGRERIEECDAGEGFMRWFTLTTKLPIGGRLDRTVDILSGNWVILEHRDASVLEGNEVRLRLPLTSEEPILFQFGSDQYPVDW
ncbi:MAG: hypothetical protein L0210_05040, partial [Rhodospirillales bacterium]|nr:hypothetical protein [Rhodospirillales bacterium]